jgi:uncharacterized integral membrane protein
MESRERQFERHWQPRLWVRVGVLVLIAAYLIGFIVGNDEEASVNFIFGEARTSIIWVILLSLLAGLIAGVLLSQLYRRRAYLRDQDVTTSEASVETPSSIADGDS